MQGRRQWTAAQAILRRQREERERLQQQSEREKQRETHENRKVARRLVG